MDGIKYSIEWNVNEVDVHRYVERVRSLEKTRMIKKFKTLKIGLHNPICTAGVHRCQGE